MKITDLLIDQALASKLKTNDGDGDSDAFKDLYESKGSKTEVNFMEDCQEMTKMILEADKVTGPDKEIARPDEFLKSSDTTEEYTVVVDEEDNTPYNCSLVNEDLSYGTYGLFNFYKMQVVEQERGHMKLILLFKRWGRAGDPGQHKKTPFLTKEEAIKEFKKVFRAKTGNSWEDLKAFAPVDKKYRLVKEESEAIKRPVAINFSLFDNTKLHPPSECVNDDMIQLMKKFYVPHSEVKYNSSLPRLPRGGLTRDTYQRGQEILRKIASLVESDETEKKDTNEQELDLDLEKKRKVTIEKLSEEYYSLIPSDNFSPGKVKKPITTHKDIRIKQEWIGLNLASQIIFAAQYRLSYHNTNPFEYIYKSLNSELQVLDNSSEDAQLILKYILNSREDCNIRKIYSVERSGEPENFKAHGVGNSWLLWHGTENKNLMSILQRGLQIAPLGTQLHDINDLFGRGIYFSDKFSKSARYCTQAIPTKGTHAKFALLCEVALGNIHPVKYSYSADMEKREAPPPGCNSFKTVNSLWEPDPSSNIVWKGRTVPLGSLIKNSLLSDTNKGGLINNEYIVYDERQVLLRYLVEFM